MDLMEDTIAHLEFQELSVSNDKPDGLSAEGYTELLASYLLKNELCNAKFLWKRIPTAVKVNSELAAIWQVGQKLWLKEMPAFYNEVQSFQWSPTVGPIINHLIASQREQMLRLVGVAYSSIRIHDVAKLLGTTPEEALVATQARGWSVVDGMIIPQESSNEDIQSSASAEDQLGKLGKLTEFVSFLEN